MTPDQRTQKLANIGPRKRGTANRNEWGLTTIEERFAPGEEMERAFDEMAGKGLCASKYRT